MKSFIVSLAFLIACGTSPGSAQMIYCQEPGPQWWSPGGTTSYNTEVADDLPASLVGRQIDVITTYVCEWNCTSWQDPDGLVVNFYDHACPPDSTPAIHFEIPWSALRVEVVPEAEWFVRRVTAALPGVVEIQAGMSIGESVINDWATMYVGLIMTDHYDVSGCEFFLDCAFLGYPRWTPGSATPWWQNIPHDLAFCLGFTGGVPADPLTWGNLKGMYR